MGSELGITGDTEHAARLDGVGIFWIVLTCAWTLLLAGGMAFLGFHRHTPILRIRGLGLSFCAVSLLHLYWISVQLGYVDGPVTPGDAEYWIMGTWLPCGIAMFHASNSRFLHVAQKQRRFAKQDGGVSARAGPPRGNLVSRFRRMEYTTRMLMLVGFGMLFQLFLTVLMYLVSRKWHDSWGIPGTEIHGTAMEKKVQMGRGWEWWPSVVWQFFWAWIVAPYILWKARGIHDTQGWRVQTIACCVASLHATPMWLVALYVPQMEAVNEYFIPPQWIAVSIMVTEAFTIFLPCWEVLRHQTLKQETLDSIAQWENKNTVASKSGRSIRTASTMVESTLSGWKSTADDSVKTGSDESVLCMGALEHVLERNPEPLQQFSALRDFSGENIAFLTSVAEWKSCAPRPTRKSEKIATEEQVQEVLVDRFNRALGIYVSFISARHADFPINISSQDLKNLGSVFEGPARIVYGDRREVDVATPFDAPVDASDSSSQASDKPTLTSEMVAQFVGTIPEGFCDGVFDAAEKSIKYLVLTNTWPKFVKDVKDRRASMDSVDSLESGTSVLQMVKERCK